MQDKVAEQNALRDLLKSGTEGGSNNGAITGDVNAYWDANPGSRQMAQEQIYMRAYGTGAPTFQQPAATTPAAPTTPVATATPTATTPAATTTTTTEDPYAAFLDEIKSRYASVTSGYLTPEQIRAQSQSQLQNQIDAINARYATLIDEEQDRGVDRLGRTRAMGVNSGTAFSPIAVGEQNRTEDVNSAAIRAIQADMGAEIAAAQAAASGFETQQINYQQEAARQAADSYISAVTSAYGLRQSAEDSASTNAARAAGLTGYFNGQPTMEMREYLNDQTQQAFENGIITQEQSRADKELTLAIEEAQKKDYQITQFDDGTVAYFDSETGDLKTLGKYAAPVRTSSAGGPSAPISVGSSPYDDYVKSIQAGSLTIGDLETAYGSSFSKAVADRYNEVTRAGGYPAAAAATTPATTTTPTSVTPTGRYGSLNADGTYGSPAATNPYASLSFGGGTYDPNTRYSGYFSR